MDTKKFKELENQYRILKMRMEMGEIGGEDFKQALKKLLLTDEEGQYWMIGGKTGKWYRYDGSKWNSGDPFAAREAQPGQEPAPVLLTPRMAAREGRGDEPTAKATPVVVAFEKPAPGQAEPQGLDAAAEAHCHFCSSRIPAPALFCPFCGGNQKAESRGKKADIAQDDLLVRRIRVWSLIFFLGGVGLIAGVIAGALFGVFPILGDVIYRFPLMLQETRGKIQGGLLFGALGGIAGFLSFALLAFFLGWLYNLVAFIFGGVRFKVRR